MMSATIMKRMQQEAALQAAKDKTEPFMVWEEGLDGLPKLPFIGDYKPNGWKLEETYLVGSSGFGAEDGPALTIPAFFKKVKVGKGYALLEVEQFQVVIGEFSKE